MSANQGLLLEVHDGAKMVLNWWRHIVGPQQKADHYKAILKLPHSNFFLSGDDHQSAAGRGNHVLSFFFPRDRTF